MVVVVVVQSEGEWTGEPASILSPHKFQLRSACPSKTFNVIAGKEIALVFLSRVVTASSSLLQVLFSRRSEASRNRSASRSWGRSRVNRILDTPVRFEAAVTSTAELLGLRLLRLVVGRPGAAGWTGEAAAGCTGRESEALTFDHLLVALLDEDAGLPGVLTLLVLRVCVTLGNVVVLCCIKRGNSCWQWEAGWEGRACGKDGGLSAGRSWPLGWEYAFVWTR